MQLGETIVEIGPGHGALTIPLAEAAKKIGARIIAVEKDAALAEILENRMRQIEKTAGNKNEDEKGGGKVKIIVGDALDFLKTMDAGLHAGLRADKIVGNIPYYISGHLLRVIGELEAKPQLAVLMLQKEVAERICAAPPKMNRLGASVQYWAEPKIIAGVSKTEFSPAPTVDSAVIELEAKLETGQEQISTSSAEGYYAAVRALFAQPRKTIINNILQADGGHTRADVEAALMKLGLNLKARPQNLTIKNIAQVAEVFFRKI